MNLELISRTGSGQELDIETGLYNYGARYYDPKISLFFGVDPLAEKFAGWSPYNYTLNNPINMIDPDGRAPDYIFEQQKDGSFKKTGKKGGATEHTFIHNNGNVTHSSKHGTHTVNPAKQARGIEKNAKRIASIEKNAGKFIEGIGTTAKYAGMLLSIVAPEFGIPLTETGQAVEVIGVGIQVGQDIANEDYSGAAKKAVMEVVEKKASDVGAKFLNDGLGEASKAAKVLNVVKEANIDATKKVISD